jgi:hypothetical protein
VAPEGSTPDEANGPNFFSLGIIRMYTVKTLSRVILEILRRNKVSTLFLVLSDIMLNKEECNTPLDVTYSTPFVRLTYFGNDRSKEDVYFTWH